MDKDTDTDLDKHIKEFNEWLEGVHIEKVGEFILKKAGINTNKDDFLRITGTSGQDDNFKYSFQPNLSYHLPKNNEQSLKNALENTKNIIESNEDTPQANLMAINISSKVENKQGAHWVFAVVLKHDGKFLGCLIDPKQENISNYKNTCNSILDDFCASYNMNGNDFYLLHGQQVENDNDSCGIWVLSYLENVINNLEGNQSAAETLDNLSKLTSEKNHSNLEKMRHRYAYIYSNGSDKNYAPPLPELFDEDENSALIQIEDSTHIYSESRIANINEIMQQSKASFAGRIKTAANVLPAVIISIVILATSLINLYTLIVSESDDNDGFDWIVFLLSIMGLVEAAALTFLNVGYIGLKQNEQFETAEGLLDKSIMLIENEENLRNDALGFIEKHKKLCNLEDGVYSNESVGRTFDLKPRLNSGYRKEVYHPRPTNYAVMGLLSLASIGLDITAIGLSIGNKPNSSAGVSIGGSAMLALATSYTAYYKVKDASKIRDINNQLSDVSDKLFEHGTKIILSLTLALEGKFDIDAFDFLSNNQALLNKKKYPEGFLQVIEQANEDLRPILIKINELVLLSLSSERSNVQLLSGISMLRMTASKLLENHVIMAADLDKLEKNMPSNKRTQGGTMYSAVKPLEAIAEKLKQAAPQKNSPVSEKSPLIQKSRVPLNEE